MNDRDAYRITLSLNDDKLQLVSLGEIPLPAPQGVSRPEEPVATGIIGYWVELQDARQQSLYRRFIHKGLPLNLHYTCGQWSALRRRKFRVSLDVPQLPQAHALVLFEQYLESPQAKTLQRKRHITVFLPQPALQQQAV
jgi:hypothetical protein